jgi:hypothetical protein
MHLPETIDEVLAELDKIIDTAVAEKNHAAIFAYVYRRTTAAIQQSIQAGLFEDNAQMEQFDVQFANYYIRAWHDYRAGKNGCAAWKLTFDAAQTPLTIAQHITLGMNAHINLDLGVAAATFMDGKELAHFKTDFMRVNAVLFSLTGEMQRKLGKVSKVLFLLDWLGRRNDERFINFGIAKARDFSWVTANRIWQSEADEKQGMIRVTDRNVTLIGQQLKAPKGWLLRVMLRTIRRFEEKKIDKIIAAMRS